MRLSKERQAELYAAIHQALTDARIALRLSPKDDVVLAQAEHAIWCRQQRVLGLNAANPQRQEPTP